MSSLEKLKTLDHKTGEIFKKLKSVPKNKLILSNNGWSVSRDFISCMAC